MGILKDAILAAIQQEHPDAHWVGNEKPHMIESTAQAKYNDVRRVERNYTKGVHKARKEAHNGISQEGYVTSTGEDYPILKVNDLSDDNAMLEFAVIGLECDILKLSFLGRIKG